MAWLVAVAIVLRAAEAAAAEVEAAAEDVEEASMPQCGQRNLATTDDDEMNDAPQLQPLLTRRANPAA